MFQLCNIISKGIHLSPKRRLSVSLLHRSKPSSNDPIKVLVTGAAGQIGYSLLPRIGRGDIWGEDKRVVLKLLDLPSTENVMHGVRMELEDCAFKALSKVEVYTQPDPAYADSDVIIMLANMMVLKADMPRSQLLKENLKVYNEISECVRKNCSKDVKILVIANPANTNCLILYENLKNWISPQNVTCLTRLDHNRSKAMIAEKLGVPNDHIRKIIVWGNHSMTMYPDIRYAEVKTANGWVKVSSLLNDKEWLKNVFLPTIRTRVSAVIRARGRSSSLSAASAGIDHLRDWLVGTPENDWVSMGIYTDPIYEGIPKGLIFGHPCTCKDGQIKVVPGLEIDAETRKMIDDTSKELLSERDSVLN